MRSHHNFQFSKLIDATTYTQTADTLGVSLKALFGEGARLVPQVSGTLGEGTHLAESGVMWVGVVLLFVFYLFVVFAYGNYVGQMGKVILGRNLGIRVADELSYLFMRAVRYGLLMGVLMWSLVGVKWLDIVGVRGVGEVAAEWLLPLFVGVGVVVGAVQRFVTNGVCWLVRRNDIAEGLNILADTTMAFVAIVTTPIVLLFVANAGVSATTLGVVCLVVAAVGLFIFCIKSLIFFIEEKVSILLLILYLCTAILIPIGIVATLVVRNSVV